MSRNLVPFLLCFSLVVGGCSSTPRWVRTDAGRLRAARSLAEADAAARRASLTVGPQLRPLRGRPWLAATPSIRAHLAELTAKADSPDDFQPAAEILLNQLVDAGRLRWERNESGLPAARRRDVSGELLLLDSAENRRLQALDTPAARRDWAESLADALPDSDPHGSRWWRRLAGLPAAPFIYGWMGWHIAHEWRGANWRDFAEASLFEPDTARDEEIFDRLDTASDADLLALYAPIVVQEQPADAHYPREIDQLGSAQLVPGPDGSPVAHVDTRRPTLYTWTGEALIEGRWCRQLSYAFWYPAHAPFKKDDPEAGRIEGLLVRLTLDARHRPLLAEAVYACGCYHRIYPGDRLLEGARLAGIVDGKDDLGGMAAPRPGKIDAILPESAGRWSPFQPHPTVYVRGGFHLVAAVRFEPDHDPEIVARSTYRLAPEEELHRLPWGDECASFFGRDGLVRGADRPEARYLFPTGIYHAGTPRAAGLHYIHFDQYDYDDPILLAHLLRLPPLADRLQPEARLASDHAPRPASGGGG